MSSSKLLAMEDKHPSFESFYKVSGLGRLWLPLATVVILFAESRWVHYKMLGNSQSVNEAILEYCLLLSLLAFFSLLPRRLSAATCFLTTCGLTLIWIFDSTYYRFFHELPSWSLLPAWRQASQSSKSLPSLLAGADLKTLLAPLLVGVLAIVWLRTYRANQGRGYIIAISFALASIAAWLFALWILPSVRWEQLQRRFNNIAIERIFGPIYYHVYDSYEYLRIQLIDKSGAKFDASRVEQAIKKSRDLATEKTPFQGIFKGRDLIFIQLEALEYFALDAKFNKHPIMPFLQKMARNGFHFRLFDQTHLGRSADGEFIYLNSIQPLKDRPLSFAYPNVKFFGLPKLFNEQGYNTIFVHPSDPSFWNAKIMAKNYGFKKLVFDSELPVRDRAKEVRGWGLTDSALFERILERDWDGEKPAFYYIVTLQCHHPFPNPSFEETKFPPSVPKSMLRRYLRCCNVRDKALQYLAEELGKTSRGRRAVLCLVGDHDSNITQSEKAAAGLPQFPESEAVPLVICTVEAALSGKPMLSPTIVPPNSFGSQMDVAPSLGHVFSLAMEKSVFLGWNLFAKQNNDPRLARIGTWMDHKGTIRPPEDHSEPLDQTQFEISDMLLQNDQILNTSRRF